MKKLLLALAFTLFAQSAWAQNPTCPTRPFGDNSNACASTAFVQAALAPISCTVTGAFSVGTGTATQCSTVEGSTAHVGNAADLYDIIIANGGQAGTILQLQDGKATLRTLVGGTNGIGLQSLIDTSVSGFAYVAIGLDTQCKNGTGGGCIGISSLVQTSNTWNPVGALDGVSGINTSTLSNRGGVVWGSNFATRCLTIACNGLYATELDVQNDIAATVEASAIWLVNKNSVVAALGYGIHISATGNNVGFDAAIRIDAVAGFSPIRTAGSILSTSAITTTHGIDLTNLTCSTDCFTSPNFKVDGIGLITLATWQGVVVTGQFGGTGVANTGKTITLGGNVSTANSFITSGNFALTLTTTATTNSTLPAGTHTLGGLDVAQTWTGQNTFNLDAATIILQAPTNATSHGIRWNANIANLIGTLYQNGSTGNFEWSNSSFGLFLSVDFATGVSTWNAGHIVNAGNVTFGTVAKTVVLKQGANGSVGTFICTGAGTITISNTNFATSDTVIISMAVAGGTITTPPAFKTVTGATGFTVLCGATDTSTYNYAIIKNAAWLLLPANDNEPFPWANKAFA